MSGNRRMKAHFRALHEKSDLDFEVNLENSITLRKSFNKDNIFISESGIQSKADIEYLQRNKISYYLIGESLMRNVFN